MTDLPLWGPNYDELLNGVVPTGQGTAAHQPALEQFANAVMDEEAEYLDNLQAEAEATLASYEQDEAGL